MGLDKRDWMISASPLQDDDMLQGDDIFTPPHGQDMLQGDDIFTPPHGQVIFRVADNHSI